MSGHTKGRAVVERHITEKESYVWYVVRIEGEIVHEGDGMYEPTADEESKMQANAALIADAFNVAHATGRTPSELADERARLLAMLEQARKWILIDYRAGGMSEDVWRVRREEIDAILAKVRNAAIAGAEAATP